VVSTQPTTLAKAHTAASPIVSNNESSALVARPAATPPARPVERPAVSWRPPGAADRDGAADGEDAGLGFADGDAGEVAVAGARRCAATSLNCAFAGWASRLEISTHASTAWAKAVPSARSAGNVEVGSLQLLTVIELPKSNAKLMSAIARPTAIAPTTAAIIRLRPPVTAPAFELERPKP